MKYLKLFESLNRMEPNFHMEMYYREVMPLVRKNVIKKCKDCTEINIVELQKIFEDNPQTTEAKIVMILDKIFKNKIVTIETENWINSDSHPTFTGMVIDADSSKWNGQYNIFICMDEYPESDISMYDYSVVNKAIIWKENSDVYKQEQKRLTQKRFDL